MKKLLECSSRGDRRFCPFYARISINGVTDSIEHFFQKAKRRRDGRPSAKSGDKCDHFICPYTLQKFGAEELPFFYMGLWLAYFRKNPQLRDIASKYDGISDMFKDKNMTPNCQPSEVIAGYVFNTDAFMEKLRNSSWYQATQKHFADKRAANVADGPVLRSDQQSQKEEDSYFRVPIDPYAVIQAKLNLSEVTEFLLSGNVSFKELERDLRCLMEAAQYARENPNTDGYVRVGGMQT